MTIEQEKLIRFLKEPLMNGSIITHPGDKDGLHSACLELEKAGVLSKDFPDCRYVIFRLIHDH